MKSTTIPDVPKEKLGLLATQYDILARTTSDVTGWRQSANNFYLASTTALAGIAAYLKDISWPISASFCVLGITICVLWSENIRSYKRLNEAKFDVLLSIEKQLAYPMFAKEREKDDKLQRKELTKIESVVPVIFIFAYVIVLVIILLQLLKPTGAA